MSSRADISPDRQLLARASPSVRCLPSLQVRSAEVFSPAMLSIYLLLNHSNTWILELDCVAAVVTASSSPPPPRTAASGTIHPFVPSIGWFE